ncbi:MAG: hypothetical protein QGH40_14905 [bacterium]|jgi:hypothetical protein|nr:hypothetical protein [bacterium]
MSRNKNRKSKPGTDTDKSAVETRCKVIIDPDGTVSVTHFTRDFMDIAKKLNPNDKRWDKFEE